MGTPSFIKVTTCKNTNMGEPTPCFAISGVGSSSYNNEESLIHADALAYVLKQYSCNDFYKKLLNSMVELEESIELKGSTDPKYLKAVQYVGGQSNEK